MRCLQPELDETDRAKSPAGWSQVKAWCKAKAGKLSELLDPDVGDRIDLLLIAIDIDIGIEAGIADPPQKVGRYEAKRLRDTIEGWLSSGRTRTLPKELVISTPVLAIEAWIIAALFRNEAAPEAIGDPAAWLVRKKKLRTSPADGKPWKELHRYRDFSPVVARNLVRVRRVCSEVERTSSAVLKRKREVDMRR